MCGIAGWLGMAPNGDGYTARLARALHHRGPDALGTRAWPAATLVHTRLSIIDLSPTGAQPLANEDGSIWTVFNGEIYNHHELRRGLKSRGHVFRGRSDTEVLPHLYEEEGAGFVSKLRGMFAFAVYDTRTRRLLLARDRFGIKPLFYSECPERLMFASEIRALRELPGVDSRPDPQAVSDFAALFFIPAPQTFFRGIRALEPGEVLEAHFDDHRVSYSRHKFHQWVIAPDPAMTLPQAEAKIADLLVAAVRPQLESDVPLGALLSGGIDSSLVSVAAQTAVPDSLRTFSVRFSDREYDETWAAQAVAQHIGSCHETLDMDDMRGSWDYITSLLVHAGQPFADTSLFAVNAVCRLMRQRVTVALSGDGGDEGFGGYDIYWKIASIDRWQSLPAPFWRGASVALTPLERLSIVRQHLPQRVREMAGADDTAIIQRLLCWVREREHSALCRDNDVLPVRRLFAPQWEYHVPQGASRLEWLSARVTEALTRLLLPNDFLFKVDTASMRESLEVRVPMLDEALFSFGLSLPHRLKARRRTCKRVLRGVARSWLPAAVASKPKRGFAIPVDKWADGDFKSRLRETLLGADSRLPEYFRPEAYRPMLEAFAEKGACPGISRQGLYQRAIMLLSVHLALSNVN
jgi:asparagine synthase (glutamine-hydrolysing)